MDTGCQPDARILQFPPYLVHAAIVPARGQVRGREAEVVGAHPDEVRVRVGAVHRVGDVAAELPGGNCIKIGLPGKRILSKRKGLREVLFSWK